MWHHCSDVVRLPPLHCALDQVSDFSGLIFISSYVRMLIIGCIIHFFWNASADPSTSFTAVCSSPSQDKTCAKVASTGWALFQRHMPRLSSNTETIAKTHAQTFIEYKKILTVFKLEPWHWLDKAIPHVCCLATYQLHLWSWAKKVVKKVWYSLLWQVASPSTQADWKVLKTPSWECEQFVTKWQLKSIKIKKIFFGKPEVITQDLQLDLLPNFLSHLAAQVESNVTREPTKLVV